VIREDRFEHYEEKPHLKEAIRVSLENFQYVQSMLGAVHTEILSSSTETTLTFRFEDEKREPISIPEYDFLVRRHLEGRSSWRPVDYAYSVLSNSEFLSVYTPTLRQLDASELDEIREMLRERARLVRG